MHRLHRTGAIALASLLLAACGAAPAPDAEPSAATAAAASASAPVPADADALRERARQAMQAQRLFAPAGDNALEHYLALRVQAPDDASVHAALVDLQPPLVIAVEQAIARGEYPESRRLLGLLARTDAQAPALPRLRESVALAEAATRERALAVDAQAREQAERAEAELRRAAEENAARLTAERASTPARPAAAPAAPVQNSPQVPVAVAQAAVDVPRVPPPSIPRVVETPRPPPVPAQQVAASAPRQAAPKLVRDVPPRYPEGALRQRQSGQVEVAFTITAEGGVAAARVVSSDLPAAFDRAALAAAARWKFEATGSSQPGSRTVRFDPPGG